MTTDYYAMSEAAEIELTGGRWVRRGLTMVWESREPLRLLAGNLVACPTCRARVSQSCRTTGGNPRVPHVTRLASRRCLCGDRVAPHKVMCATCRESARRESYRLREVRRPTSQRRRAVA